MANAETYEGSSVSYQGLVVFDPANVKHIDADEFDASDSGLYNRQVQAIPQGDTGDLVTELINGNIDGVADIDAGMYGEMLEEAGLDPSTSSAVMSMMRGRTLNAKETLALSRRNPLNQLKSHSEHGTSGYELAGWLVQRLLA